MPHAGRGPFLHKTISESCSFFFASSQNQSCPKPSIAHARKMVSFVPLLGKVHFGLKQQQFSKAKRIQLLLVDEAYQSWKRSAVFLPLPAVANCTWPQVVQSIYVWKYRLPAIKTARCHSRERANILPKGSAGAWLTTHPSRPRSHLRRHRQ